MNSSAKLDAYQLAAVNHDDGPAVVLAGPGAGKTRVLTYRVARLLESGVPLNEIFCITFSNAAAAEMRARIAALAGPLAGNGATLARRVSTFHALALRIIYAERHLLTFRLDRNPIADGRRVLSVLRPLVRGTGITAGQARAAIAALRRRLWDHTPQEILESATNERERELAGIYCGYDTEMQRRGWLDFDSMVPLAVRLLQNPQVRQRWAARHVIVDEAHDCSADQQAVAQCLTAVGGSLFCVGDPSQSIYGFRSGNADLLKNGARGFILPVNYRSAPEILAAFAPYADKDNAAQRLVENFRAADQSRGCVVRKGFDTAEVEAENVAAAIQLDQQAPKDTAVLARTNAQLAIVAEALVKIGLPVRWRLAFWNTPEVVGALALLRLAVDPQDEQAFREALASPARAFRYLGPRFADSVIVAAKRDGKAFFSAYRPDGEWREYQLERWESAREALRFYASSGDAVPQTVLSMMLAEFEMWDAETETAPDDRKDENLAALVSIAGQYASIEELLAHAAAMHNANQPNGVTLSTIHRSKGLEWESVYLIGLSDGLLPHRNATDWEEERRLVYVAMSRARRKLGISWHGKPSPLLDVKNLQVGR